VDGTPFDVGTAHAGDTRSVEKLFCRASRFRISATRSLALFATLALQP